MDPKLVVSRESKVWLVGIVISFVTYLINEGDPPTQWAYQDWLQAISFIAAAIFGVMNNSPLHSQHTMEVKRKLADFEEENRSPR